MISQEFLDKLRCPLDTRTRLEATPEGLLCQRCHLRFPVKQGIPCLVVEDAELPAGCSNLQELPCQQKDTVASREKVNSPDPQRG